MKYTTVNNRIVNSVYRCAIRGNYRNAVYIVYNEQPKLSIEIFKRVMFFLLENTRLIDFAYTSRDYQFRNIYNTLLDKYIKLCV